MKSTFSLSLIHIYDAEKAAPETRKGGALLRLFALLDVSDTRKFHKEPVYAVSALRPDPAVMACDDRLRDRQAKPEAARAASGGIRPVKALEDVFQIFGCDRLALVCNRQHAAVPVSYTHLTNMKDGSIGKISENRFARADLEHILLCVDDDMRMEALRQTNNVKSIVTAQGKMDLELSLIHI